MKTPEQWLEETFGDGAACCHTDAPYVQSKEDIIALIQAIQKDAVDEGLTRAITQLRSFLHNQLHKVNFGHKP